MISTRTVWSTRGDKPSLLACWLGSANWLIRALDSLSQRLEIVINGIRKAGILDALKSDGQCCKSLSNIVSSVFVIIGVISIKYMCSANHKH